MAARPLPQRVARAVGTSPLAERLATASRRWYATPILWTRRTPLHTDVLGHSLHPPMTDLVAGSWVSASILDIGGGPEARAEATLLTGVGLVAAVPTALAGAADWWDLEGAERRIGAVHGFGNDIAIALFAGSLVARLRGGHGIGVGLALAGNLVLVGTGFLGGHLALHYGNARRADRD